MVLGWFFMVLGRFWLRKYYKKSLSPKTFGLESCEEVVELVRDTVLITGKSKVLEAQLPEASDQRFEGVSRRFEA